MLNNETACVIIGAMERDPSQLPRNIFSFLLFFICLLPSVAFAVDSPPRGADADVIQEKIQKEW